MFTSLRTKVLTLLAVLGAVFAGLVALVSVDVIAPQTAWALAAGAGFLGMPFMTNDDAIKYLIAVGFLDAAGGNKAQRVTPKTGNYTIVTGTDPSGTLFTNRGAAGTIVFTLPAPSQSIAGTYYEFATVVAQIITVATATVDTLIADNDAAADSLSTTARIGVALRLTCDGTSWIATLASGVPQAAFAQTGTVAT